MDYGLNEQQEEIVKLAFQLAQQKLRPVREHYDQTEEFPWPVVDEIRKADLFGVYLPEKYGGTGGGTLDLCLVVEQLSRALLLSPRPRETLLDAVRLLAAFCDEPTARRILGDLKARASERLQAVDGLLADATLADLLGDGALALSLIRQRPQPAEEDVDLVLRVSDVEARYGDRAEAVSALEILVAEEPESPLRLNALGFTLADAGIRLAEAAVWLRRAHRLAPDEPFIIDSLGWVFFRQGDLPRALALLETAARAEPGDPEILFHLGEAYRAAQWGEEARGAYRAASERITSPLLRQLLTDRLRKVSPP